MDSGDGILVERLERIGARVEDAECGRLDAIAGERVDATVCSGALCVFNYAAQSATSLAKLHVDFPVNPKPTRTVDTYELVDDLVLRNSTRS